MRKGSTPELDSQARASRKENAVRTSARVHARGSGDKSVLTEARSAPNGELKWLIVVGARQNNLKNITVDIPLGRFVCVTGVSGSGKSSLVNDIMREALARDLNGAENVAPGAHDRLDGLEHLDKVIDIDQSPIGRTPRSNPATYIRVFDEIRALFTKLPDARVRGYKPGRFSFNVSTGAAGGGRCEACEGNGSHRMEMEFLADIWVTCPVCNGRRFSRETLQILYKGKSIADVLEMDVQQAWDHFQDVPKIANMLQTLHDVGLDYIKLGQSSTTLSGGEAQRIKLSRELVKKSTGRTLYILDEPTTGLHFADIKRLLAVLHGFVDAGNTVVVIEHNLDVVKTADWVIDLGPEGGEAGGLIVDAGTPEEIAESSESHTGSALREILLTSRGGARPDKSPNKSPGRPGARANKRSQANQDSANNDLAATIHDYDKAISVVGARQNNLKNVSVDLPRGKTTVCSGPSGSGKSSFAIDTLYAEGRRRYVESLSAYARQFLGRLQPPKVDHVYGLSPAISIEQRNTSKSPRSTVGTVTEIHDYMRVLWARVGRPYCPKCKVPVSTQTSDEIVGRLLELGEGEKVILLAPVETAADESYVHLLQRERANGYTRVRIDGRMCVLDELLSVGSAPDAAEAPHDLKFAARSSRPRIELVVDRVVIRKSQRGRIADSVEQALAVGQGLMIAQLLGDVNPDQNRPLHAVASNARLDLQDKSRRVKGKGAGGETSKHRNAETSKSPKTAPANQRNRNDEWRFSQHRSCSRCGETFGELTPAHFSFNSRLGWCESCDGLGTQQGASPAAIVVHPTRSILDGALAGWNKLEPGSKLFALAAGLARHLGFDPHTAWNDLSDAQQQAILQGCGDEWIELDNTFEATGNDRAKPQGSKTAGESTGLRFRWRGFFPAIGRATRVSWQFRKRLEELVTEVPCEACGGSRLNPESAAARVDDSTMHEVCRKPLAEALQWFQAVKLDRREKKIAGELLHEITSRLRFLVDVGLDYLTLHRTASTLSGGEAQRIQLASQIGTGLTGVLYVLDEPTIGLHPSDNDRLIQALRRLRDLGNTLVLVEHDREVIEAADQVLDFGPGAGAFGGEITAQASPKQLRSRRASLTGRYLSNRECIPVPSNRRAVPLTEPRSDLIPDEVLEGSELEPDETSSNRRHQQRESLLSPARGRKTNRSAEAKSQSVNWLTVQGAREHNLKEIDVSFPLGRFTCVTGVSGSGKSTLVSSILYNALAARIHRARLVPGGHERIIGLEHLDKVINVDQSPIGVTPTSNPATYTGVFDTIREWFAKLPLSRVRGYSPNRFSFNRPGGRCEACQGMGQRCIEMHFLPDVWVECEGCGGKRFTTETLEVRYRNRSIADVLEMRVAEALELFDNVPKIHRMMQTLDDVGLGYIQLGQSGTTLSGGEAQRVKLATELGRPSTGKTLYILDEPTTGLHFDDLKKLLNVLHRLVDLGNTVICIEHNLDVIKTADWVIDLGPEAGAAGGWIVAAGTPEKISRAPKSRTGKSLAPILEAGPLREREVFDPSKQRRHQNRDRLPLISRSPALYVAKQSQGDVNGKGVSRSVGADHPGTHHDDHVDNIQMPWERDGKSWHTVNHLDREGNPVAWDTAALLWTVDSIEQYGDFAPTDWNHRTRIEVKAPGNTPWFAHIRTGGKDLFEVALRVRAKQFTHAALTKQLPIKTLDERNDLPIYGQWSRLRLRRHDANWDEITLHLRDFKDISRTAFKKFLRTAAASYFSVIDDVKAEPEKAAPWAKLGKIWHLSQRSINRRQPIQWQPTVLPALIGQFMSIQPDLLIDWNGQTSVSFTVPGEDASAGKIVTNMARGLRVELRAPRGTVTPVMIDRLGEDTEIKIQAAYDRVIYWIHSLEQGDMRQLRAVWTICRSEPRAERLVSA